LQRLLKQQTGRSPVFWLRLARVRRAASRLAHPRNLAELAYDMGYADQAHMTREFRYWLGATPRQISHDTGWLAQHLGLGYGA
jgi:AraC-like DNA-binding protein